MLKAERGGKADRQSPDLPEIPKEYSETWELGTPKGILGGLIYQIHFYVLDSHRD